MTRFLLPAFVRFGAAVVALNLVAVLLPSVARAASGPRSTAEPMVAGHVIQGRRLFASPGEWSASGRLTYAYQWFRCDTMGAHCALLRGVTGKSHLLGGDDVGHTLEVRVRVGDSTGSRTRYSSLIGPIVAAPPRLVSTVQPRVSGQVAEGGTVQVGTGTWRPMPSSFTYQWARCNRIGRACAPIPGATASTHEVAADDLDHSLLAIVQARLGVTQEAVLSLPATASATKAPAPAPAPVPESAMAGPANVSPPLVAEVLQVGKRLTGASGNWSGSGQVRLAYQWYRCDASGAQCKSIHGATAITYALVARDVGQTLGFAVRATDSTGTKSAYASLVGPIADTGAALVSSMQPTIVGEAKAGQTLQVSGGSWSPAPSSLAYQWERCNPNGRLCAAITGATATSYTVAAEDAGHSLLAVVRATAGAATQDVLSVMSAPVPAVTVAGPTNLGPPTVTGTSQQGQRLTGAAGSWSGPGTPALAYQWYRCDASGAHCNSIHGATALTYTLVARDVGQTLGFAVRATDATGTTSAYASLVGPIAGPASASVSTAQPAIAGTPRPGQVLQVSNGAWSVAPASFAYQWEQCNPNGRLCTPITGATATSYAVTPADVGHGLHVIVEAVSAGSTQAALSAAVVAAG